VRRTAPSITHRGPGKSGNTTTALWNYAQNFAMNDNSFGTTFGPSTPGALNLISGNKHGAVSGDNSDSHHTPAPSSSPLKKAGFWYLDFRVILPPGIEAADPSHQHECPC
jgi:Phosphoesterase family